MKDRATGCRPDQLFGVWAIEPARLEGLVEAVRSIDLNAARAAAADGPSDGSGYELLVGGIALISLAGPLTKYTTSFQSVLGGSSTLLARNAVRQASRDPQVRGIMLKIDSPGGTVAGTGDLADAVRAANSRKPVHAYIEDQAGSAAFYIASAAGRVSANPTGWVGGIGCFARLEDTSGAAAAAGVKVHIVSSGGVKGGGAAGAPITEEALAEAQRVIDEMAGQFVAAVAKGRGIPIGRVRELADGRMHVAAQAQGLGLIDAVGSWDDALKALRSKMSEDNAAAALALAEEQEARAVRAEQELAQVRSERDGMRSELSGLRARVEVLERPAPADPLEALAATATPEQQVALAALRREATEREAEAARLRAEQQTAAFRARAEALGSETKGLRLPTTAEALGGVLQRAAANALTDADRGELERLLRAGNNALAAGHLTPIGTTADQPGGGDPVAEVRARTAALMAKEGGLTEAAAQAKVLGADRGLYDRYTQATQVKV